MSEPPLDPRPPGGPEAPARGARRFLSTEWGLAALALLLAGLVWAVMWRRISRDVTMKIRLEPRTSEAYVAFHEGEVDLELRGPQGEIDGARTRLGEARRVVVNLKDPPPGREDPRIPILSPDQYAFPFSKRLVFSVSPTAVEIYRWTEVQVRVLEPEVRDLPAGVIARVTLDPATAVVRAPAGRVGEAIRPDPVSVKAWFAERGSEALPAPRETELTFNAWHDEPAERRYRAVVVLPAVSARLEYEFLGKKDLRNRIVFQHDPGFTVTPSGTEQDLDIGYYTGKFEGAEKDLATLAQSLDSWWFVVRVPRDKLPADADTEVNDYLPIEYAHTQALDPLRVRFAASATLMVVIRRAP